MIRTRDFVLIFTVLAFLFATIGFSTVKQWIASSSEPSNVQEIQTGTTGVASTSDLVMDGSLAPDETIDRAARLGDMRAKISALQIGVPKEPPVVVEEEPDSPAEILTQATSTSTETGITEEIDPAEIEEVEVPVVENKVVLCPNYNQHFGFWDSRNLSLDVREGAIVVERVVGTSTQVQLQLLGRVMPSAVPNCLSSDVIGIANDGSLIRNDEMALYSIFGSETRVGYSLDGFPIHGTSEVRGDACGGRMVGGQYRYELKVGQESLINCFASTPTRLP